MAWDFLRGKQSLTDNVAISLTPTGKQKADNFDGEGAWFAVLAALAENDGVATVSEIANDAHLSTEKAQAVIKAMIKAGYCKVQRPGGEG